jgi:hypothetical protein
LLSIAATIWSAVSIPIVFEVNSVEAPEVNWIAVAAPSWM